MQIGCCWFDINQSTLSNQEKDTSWKMPTVEFVVLEILVRFRDQVLSKDQLLQLLPEEQRTTKVLQQAIGRLRFFLGESSAKLLESIDDQGYILHTRMKASVKNSIVGPFGTITNTQYSIIIAQLVFMLLLIYAVFDPSVSIKPANEHVLNTPGGVVNFYPVYASQEQESDMFWQYEAFAEQLTQCQNLPWKGVFYSISSNNQLGNIVLKDHQKGQVENRNIKVSAANTDFSFIDQDWLIKAGICEEN